MAMINNKTYTNYIVHNMSLPKPTHLPEGHVETVEEFVARGGKITIVPPYESPRYDSVDAVPKKK